MEGFENLDNAEKPLENVENQPIEDKNIEKTIEENKPIYDESTFFDRKIIFFFFF